MSEPRAGLAAVIPLSTATALAAAAVALEVAVRGFGFPDGHLTALERAYAELWAVGRAACVVACAHFVALAVLRPRGRAWTALSYAALGLALAWAVWRCVTLAGALEDGGGG